MGAANSCSYSDLATQLIDNAVIDARGTSFQEIFYCGRYRDDCTTLWPGNVDKIDLLLELLNCSDETLNFTVDISGKSLCFLDLKITIDEKNLWTLAYSKPTDSHRYLDGTLCHPTKGIDGISTGVVKRLKRICCNDSNFLEQSKKYSAYLVARDHKQKKIIRAFEKIDNQPRSTVQQKRAKSKIKPGIFIT